MTLFKKYVFTLCLCLLVGFATLYFGTQQAEAQRTGPYMLVAHSNETANVGIFKLDTSSGAVSFCFLEGGSNNIALRCTPAVNN